jgi:hypothetical protein
VSNAAASLQDWGESTPGVSSLPFVEEYAFEIEPKSCVRLTLGQKMLLPAGVLLAAFSSVVSSGMDPWITNQSEQIYATHASYFVPISRRRITLRRAREIALRILEQAEKERLQTAEEEAQRGINWEELS